jgi:hypothetical protein
MWAVSEGHIGLVEGLLGHGADRLARGPVSSFSRMVEAKLFLSLFSLLLFPPEPNDSHIQSPTTSEEGPPICFPSLAWHILVQMQETLVYFAAARGRHALVEVLAGADCDVNTGTSTMVGCEVSSPCFAGQT